MKNCSICRRSGPNIVRPASLPRDSRDLLREFNPDLTKLPGLCEKCLERIEKVQRMFRDIRSGTPGDWVRFELGPEATKNWHHTDANTAHANQDAMIETYKRSALAKGKIAFAVYDEDQTLLVHAGVWHYSGDKAEWAVLITRTTSLN